MKRRGVEQVVLKSQTFICVSINIRKRVLGGFTLVSEVRRMKMNEGGLKFLCWDYLKNHQT